MVSTLRIKKKQNTPPLNQTPFSIEPQKTAPQTPTSAFAQTNRTKVNFPTTCMRTKEIGKNEESAEIKPDVNATHPFCTTSYSDWSAEIWNGVLIHSSATRPVTSLVAVAAISFAVSYIAPRPGVLLLLLRRTELVDGM